MSSNRISFVGHSTTAAVSSTYPSRRTILWLHGYRSLKALTLIPFIAVSSVAGCAPNRAAWMAKAANQQSAAQTGDFGTPDQVRAQAKLEVTLLSGMATAIYGRADKYSDKERAVYLPLAQYDTQVASGLEAIADSRDDTSFTNAIFGMCDPSRLDAEPRVGRVELAIANALEQGQIDRDKTPQQRAQEAALVTAFGNTMISILSRCVQANAQMAEASQEEQQAEVQHQANVDRSLAIAESILLATAVVAGQVGAAAATRPPVQNNYLYVNQYNSN
jgi:hypothetical protein